MTIIANESKKAAKLHTINLLDGEITKCTLFICENYTVGPRFNSNEML